MQYPSYSKGGAVVVLTDGLDIKICVFCVTYDWDGTHESCKTKAPEL